MNKKFLGYSVLEASKTRIQNIFDNFENVCVSFSGGKDSTVLLHLTAEEAIKRKRKIGLFFVDWEAQYTLTINFVKYCFDLYKEAIEPYWVSLPLKTTNAVSQFEPEWICWEEGKNLVRNKEELPEYAITDYNYFSFYSKNMTFEEFTPKFGKWYSKGKLTANLIGIRTVESLNRWRTIYQSNKIKFNNYNWTTKTAENVFNAYPLYDWQTKDIWIYNSKFKKKYNKLYDRMYQAGLSIHQMRICEPFGDEQRRGLWLYQVVEPETWVKLVSRVNGANSGSLYSNETGNILGNSKITKPNNHTWESFVKMLLQSMPVKTAEHYKNKIAVWIRWYQKKEKSIIYDYLKGDTGSIDMPSWRRVCKMLLKNDYWCKTLSFSPTKTAAYDKYIKLMKCRREKWKVI